MEICLLKPVLDMSLQSHAGFAVGETECRLEELPNAEALVMKSLTAYGKGFVNAVGSAEGFRLSWPRNSDRYHFIALRVKLHNDQKIIQPDGDSPSYYQPHLVEAAVQLHRGRCFEDSYSHVHMLPLTELNSYFREKGLTVEELSDGVQQATLPGRGTIEYASCCSRVLAGMADDAQTLAQCLGEIVGDGVSHTVRSSLFPITISSFNRFESGRLVVGEPKSGSPGYLGWRTIRVGPIGMLGREFWHYALVQAVVEEFMMDLLFIRETAYSIRSWVERQNAVFDNDTRKRGFVYVELTQEVLAQLTAWLPNMVLRLNLLERDLTELASDPYASMYGEESDARKARALLKETIRLEERIDAVTSKLGERVNRRWDEMNTRIVIQKSQSDILSDIQKLNESMGAISQTITDVGQQQTVQLVGVLSQVRDNLKAANNPRAKEAQGLLDKLSTGVGLAASVAAVVPFLTGVASVPTMIPLLPAIQMGLSGVCRRFLMRH